MVVADAALIQADGGHRCHLGTRAGRGRLRSVVAIAAACVLLLGACSSSSSHRAATSSRRTAATQRRAPARTRNGAQPSQESVARNAFLAGYPLVVTARTMQTFAGLVGVNRMLRVPRLSAIGTKLVVAPNHDTTYALAILDLRGEPQALTVPPISRYYTFQLIDAWMDTIANIGTRTTGGRPGTWVVVPPGYTGTLPAGTHRIDSPTNQLIVLGRVRAVDDADAPAAFAATARLQLRPLSVLTGGAPAAAAAPAMPKPVGTPQSVGQNGLSYFDEMDDALAVNPPVNAEQREAVRLARSLHVGPGLHTSTSATASERRVLAAGVAQGTAGLDDERDLGAETIDGWTVNLHLGDRAAHLDLRRQAIIAKHYWGPNVAAESVYPIARTADDGMALTGAKNYVIHLRADDLPPVRAFWSYTVYGSDSFFVANAINRYSISGDTPGLVRSTGGSIDLYLSHDPPSGHEANWLPTPTGTFRLVMRLYLPERPVLDGAYRYPAVRVVRS